MTLKKIFIGEKVKKFEQWSKESGIPVKLANAIYMCIEDPAETPFLLERVIIGFNMLSKKAKEEVRRSLIRVQIGFSITIPTDPILTEKQLFVSQVLEKLLFGDNLFLREEIPPEKVWRGV